jgi:hypothetical protein
MSYRGPTGPGPDYRYHTKSNDFKSQPVSNNSVSNNSVSNNTPKQHEEKSKPSQEGPEGPSFRVEITND